MLGIPGHPVSRSAADPPTFVAGAAFLVAIAVIASAIPAARAMRIPIVEALRQE
jgi:ABC-type lipoprotein release transport system permease subunit